MQEKNWAILVIDNEQPIVDVTTAVLNQAGFTALGTTDPEEAVRLVETNDTIKVLLSDVMMPKATGPELVRRVQKVRDGDLRIVFMSGGFDDVPFRQTDRLLSKPFTFPQLIGEIRNVLAETPPSPWHGPERRRQK